MPNRQRFIKEDLVEGWIKPGVEFTGEMVRNPPKIEHPAKFTAYVLLAATAFSAGAYRGHALATGQDVGCLVDTALVAGPFAGAVAGATLENLFYRGPGNEASFILPMLGFVGGGVGTTICEGAGILTGYLFGR